MYGVTFSDKILNSVAQTLISTVKNAGNIYRSSGANFIISFKDMSKDELHHVYDDIVYELSNHIVVENMKVPLKICAGAVYIEPHMNEINAIRSRRSICYQPFKIGSSW